MVYSKFLRGVVAVLLLGVMPARGMDEPSVPAGVQTAITAGLDTRAVGIFATGSGQVSPGATEVSTLSAAVSRPDLERFAALEKAGTGRFELARIVSELQSDQANNRLPISALTEKAKIRLHKFLKEVARWKAYQEELAEVTQKFQVMTPEEDLFDSSQAPTKERSSAESARKYSGSSAGAGGALVHERRRRQGEEIGDFVAQKLFKDYVQNITNRHDKLTFRILLGLEATYLPTWSNRLLNTANKRLIEPFTSWQERNAANIAAITKLMFIFSAMAVIFHHSGGTQWMKRKIDEAFNKPNIYKVDTAKTLSEDKQRMSGELLVNGPEVQRQCNEVVELMRWHNALPKDKQREYKFKGVLFYGPPGTGKTSLARTIAYRSGWNLIELIADDFFKIKDMADRLAVLEEMFAKAEKLGKTVIFLDEFENMVKDRDLTGGASNPMLMKMLKLTEQGSSKFIIIAATNRKSDIDKAMLRRMRWQVEVPLPGLRQRYQILNNYFDTLLRNKGFSTKLDAMKLAQTLHSESGARLESFVERMRDRARLYGQTEIDEKIAKEILIDMGILQAGPEEDDVVGKEAVHRDRGDGNGDSEEVAA